MKIIYVITRSDVIGGASIHLLDLASGIQNLGNEVMILVGGEGILFDSAASAEINCVAVRSLRREVNVFQDVKCYFDLRKIFKEYKPDLIHVHSSKAGFLGRLASRSLKIPVVFTAHGWAFTEGVSALKRFVYRYVEKIAAVYSTAIITVSDYDRRLALSYKVGNEKLVTTVHNGMPDILNQTLKKESDTDCFKLIMVARFDYQKNHHDLLYALANVTEYDWKLDLIGDGPLLEVIKVLAKKLNIYQKINFAGASNKVSDFLYEADVFLLISNWEGLPLTILEAMRAGLPVIASDVGGVSECVISHKNGFLIERSDIEALTLSLKQFMNSPSLINIMGKKSRCIYELSFTFEHMLQGTLNVYLNALSDS